AICRVWALVVWGCTVTCCCHGLTCVLLGAAVRWVLTLLDNRATLIKIEMPPVYQRPAAALYHQLADKVWK
ncbi:hypothetical protein, partial [Sphingopyxis sp.]|uniref:hypothetical protein n=1 Tax=Sphingopyxis sp. TaxID=1908224 RepID=UPI0040372C8E